MKRPDIEWMKSQMGQGGDVPNDKVRALIEYIIDIEEQNKRLRLTNARLGTFMNGVGNVNDDS